MLIIHEFDYTRNLFGTINASNSSRLCVLGTGTSASCSHAFRYFSTPC